MLAASPAPMSFEDYLVWEAEQEAKWELVDGVPVPRSGRLGTDPVTGLAGGTLRHADIAANVVAALRRRLRGGPCRAFGSDLKVETPAGDGRYPDVTVDCGPYVNALVAPNPRVAFEVLSPSNTPGQQMRLVADYQSISTIEHVIFVEQGRANVIAWSRPDGPWKVKEHGARRPSCPCRRSRPTCHSPKSTKACPSVHWTLERCGPA